ncbi:MAG: acetolactate decarboxylase [Verrucomicrobia bacterium]|nr:acetolactate decarboxylase [Verrucomicrobiota bacterium]
MESMLYMSSPINALLEGFYRNDITIDTLKQKGDFGIGTFNNLDGEMIALDGRFFQLDFDGNAHPVDGGMKTPFSTVCRFKKMLSEEVGSLLSYEEFSAQLEKMLPSDNMFYAIKMYGRFRTMKTRSVPRTEDYRPLSEATDHQKVRQFDAVDGFLAGFYTPSFVPSVNVPGYHFHFINESFTAGGHMLSCEPERLDIQIQIFYSMELTLPKTLDYATAAFTRDAKKDLEKAER